MTAFYAYAVVPASFDPAGAPTGIDDGPVDVVRAGAIAALVTPIEEATYDPTVVAERSQDLAWLGARASAHDQVMSWAVDHTTVIPLPLFSLFHDATGVQQMLARRAVELRETLDRLRDAREYTVRIYRLDQQILASMSAHSREIADLESRAAHASPGQRYLLDRKLEQARRAELERISHESARAAFATLSSLARSSARDAVASQAAASGHAILNASFLVCTPDVEAFRLAVTRLIAELGPRGFRTEFTGPWAPYHFVGVPDQAAASPTAAGAPPDGRSM